MKEKIICEEGKCRVRWLSPVEKHRSVHGDSFESLIEEELLDRALGGN